MAVACRQVGRSPHGTIGATADALKTQSIDAALDRAFLQGPLPNDETTFKRRIEEGRMHLALIANEVAWLAGTLWMAFRWRLQELRVSFFA